MVLFHFEVKNLIVTLTFFLNMKFDNEQAINTPRLHDKKV